MVSMSVPCVEGRSRHAWQVVAGSTSSSRGNRRWVEGCWLCLRLRQMRQRKGASRPVCVAVGSFVAGGDDDAES